MSNSTVIEKTDFFEARVENRELREEKKKSSTVSKKKKGKIFSKTRKQDDSKTSVVVPREELTVEHKPTKNTAFCMGNAATLQTSINPLRPMLASTTKNKKMCTGQERAKYCN